MYVRAISMGVGAGYPRGNRLPKTAVHLEGTSPDKETCKARAGGRPVIYHHYPKGRPMLINPKKLLTPEAVEKELVRIKAVVDTARRLTTKDYAQRRRELLAWLAVLEGGPAAETEEGEED